MSEVRVTISNPKDGELLTDLIISDEDTVTDVELSRRIQDRLELLFGSVEENEY